MDGGHPVAQDSDVGVAGQRFGGDRYAGDVARRMKVAGCGGGKPVAGGSVRERQRLMKPGDVGQRRQRRAGQFLMVGHDEHIGAGGQELPPELDDDVC